MSAVLWLVSLTQVSLVIDNGLGHPSLWRGTTTLYSGWMGPIAWYFAWYANITFLIGLAYVAAGDNGRISRTLAAVSILLALDMFRVTSRQRFCLAVCEVPLVTGRSGGHEPTFASRQRRIGRGLPAP
jgi:hypothetical protein